MKQYLDMMRLVRETGAFKQDRTGTGTYSIFAHQMRFNLADGFPLVTTKRTHLKSIIHELLWFLQGSTNIRYLKENGVKIWDEWVLDGTAEYVDLSLNERWAIYTKDIDAWQAHIHKEAANNELLGLYPQVMRHLRIGTDEEQHAVLDSHRIGAWKYAAGEDKGDPVPRKRLVAGELGPVYGSQWRSWPKIDIVNNEIADLSKELWDEVYHAADQNTYAIYNESIDQISNLVDQLKRNPDSRRLIVSAWNPAEVDEMALPPCHCLFQFYTAPLTWEERWHIAEEQGYNVDEYRGCVMSDIMVIFDQWEIPSRKLSCQLYQRSCDVFLGVPFNIASYALLTMMVAQVTNMVPGEFIWTGGDIHIYSNHLEQVDLQLTRTPHALPKMKINPDVKDLFGFTIDDFELVDYVHDAAISAPIAV